MELFKEPLMESEADLYRPLLNFLRAKKSGRFLKPYFPKWELLPLYKQCKLALLWKEAGFHEEASRLASWILQLENFPCLWCPEKEFDEFKIRHWFAKVRDEIVPNPSKNLGFDLTLIQTPKISAALTLEGKGTSLGMVRAGGEIRAFGPESGKFGIQGKGMEGWTRTAAYPEVWLQMKPEVRGEGLALSFRFVGLTPEHPLSLAFYIKGGSCEVGREILKPKSLRRFSGEVQEIRFQNQWLIRAEEVRKVQIIPLAGEGCFWGTDFLVSYPISPAVPQILLHIEAIAK